MLQIDWISEEENRLRQKLASLESKVIVGGENLLDRVEQQASLLEETRKELEKRKAKEDLLRMQLQEKEVWHCFSFLSGLKASLKGRQRFSLIFFYLVNYRCIGE